jgi:transcription initiation factor TFIIF subunit alpha
MSSDLKRSGSAGVKVEGGIKREGSDGSNSNKGVGSSTIKASAAASREPSPPPPTGFRDIPLYSTSLEDWKYHLMKMASFTNVDPSDTTQFPWPVKLNRKWPPKLKDDLPIEGDPVLDAWGKPIMIPVRKDPNDPYTANGLPSLESKKKIPLLWPGPDDDVQEVEELVARLEGPK